jgi:hypothetical protein
MTESTAVPVDGPPRIEAEQPAPGMQKLNAGLLLLAYSHLWLLRLLVEGTDRPAALRTTARWFFHELLPATGEKSGLRVVVGDGDEPHALPSACLARAARLVRDTLGDDPDMVLRRCAQSTDLPTTSAAESVWLSRSIQRKQLAFLPATDVASCIMLAETTRRVAEGVELLAAARGADDWATGRPRQRRAPVELDWLTRRVGHEVEVVWPALRDAKDGQCGPLLAWPGGDLPAAPPGP